MKETKLEQACRHMIFRWILTIYWELLKAPKINFPNRLTREITPGQIFVHKHIVINVKCGMWNSEYGKFKWIERQQQQKKMWKKMNHFIFRTQSFVSTEHSIIYIRNDRLLNDLSCIWLAIFLRHIYSYPKSLVHILYFSSFSINSKDIRKACIDKW